MKKGFTLIELLAIIAILVFVFLIATPKLIDVVKEARTRAYHLNIDKILHAASIYVVKNVELEIPDYVSVQTLVDDKLLESVPVDPRDGKKIPADSLININQEGNGQYSYDFVVDPFFETTGSIDDYISTYDEGFSYTFEEIRFSQLEGIVLKIDQIDLEQSIVIEVNDNVVASAINATNNIREWKEYSIPPEYLRSNGNNIVEIFHNGGSADWGHIYEVILDGN